MGKNLLYGKWCRGFVIGMVFTLMSARADEIGPGSCGPKFLVRGEVRHVKSDANRSVENASDPGMYEEELVGRNFTAIVEGLPEGIYTIEIYLAEMHHTQTGKRVMDISCGSEPLEHDLDVFAKVGGYREYVVRKEVVHQEDSINGPLTIRFERKNDNAKFNAIQIKDPDGVVVACVKARELLPDDLWAHEIPVVDSPVVYTNSHLPFETRIDDLILRMSLKEKAQQLMNSAPSIDRLGVPAYDYWNECLHGVARAGHATVFPQAIGMAAMWDQEMMHDIADGIATEARAKNNGARKKDPNTRRYYGLTFWTPNINIFRDPRWGRGHETYGEDPYLTGRLGVSFIQGLQGNDPKYMKAMACAKHFAVHNGPEKLRHTFNVDPSKRDLYETYLPQFEAAVTQGHVGIVMSVYNAVYGVPGPANHFLITDLLRNQWGFDGHVVSDCGAVRDIYSNHHYVETAAEASAVAIKAGNDLNCGGAYAALTAAIKQELVSEAEIEAALKRVLMSRFRLGLFDTPEQCAYLNIPESMNDTAEHSQLSLEAARRSIVMLKNNGVLPLQREGIKRIAVIGPNADSLDALLGNYNGDPSYPITVLQGIRAAAGPDIEVSYARGCPLALKPDEDFSLSSQEAREARELAKTADVILFVGGLDAHLEGEEMRTSYVGFDRGDRSMIELPEPQEKLLKALVKTRKPVVFVNLSGSAIAMPWAAETLPAIVQAWYPGQNGGTAVADVLFGNINPSGRLPITFYRSTDDLPEFTDYSMQNRTYRYFKGKPLFAFGHGLSYTTFAYSKLQTSAAEMTRDDTIKVRLEVVNTGDRAGDEVVQLYVRHLNPNVPQPLHSLAGFQRVTLDKAEAKVVEFDLPASALRYWDEDKEQYVVPVGGFEIQIGGASDDIRSTTRLDIVSTIE